MLSVVGDHDTLSIDPADRDRTVAAEPAAYPASPRGDVKVIPDAGHDLALQLTVSAPREPMPDRQAGPWHSDVYPPHLPENQPVGAPPRRLADRDLTPIRRTVASRCPRHGHQPGEAPRGRGRG